MHNPEIMLLGGAPGTGKSSIAKKAVEISVSPVIRHLSIGDLKRSIVSGETPSAYAEMLKQREHPSRKTGAAPSEAMTGIMEEFILAKPEGLTIVDGFPRYMDRLEPFKESMQRIGANVLAVCVVDVDESLLIERLTARAERKDQVVKDPVERLTDHTKNVIPTLKALEADYPAYHLDGSLDLEVNAHALIGIYNEHTDQKSL